MSDQTHELEFNKTLKATETPIAGLVVYDLPVFGDNRGWFKENWQREKMRAIGLPDFGPVQNNISFSKRGSTRGIHAEPWDKYISLASGKVFAYWVDIREDSTTYGKVHYEEIDPTKAVYVPAGVANGFQTLEDNTAYSYLVNDHWSADAKYANVSLFDESLAIPYPIPLSEAEVSDKDKTHPPLKDVKPLKPKKVLVTGGNGQLGMALRALYPDAEFVDRDELDITSDISSARRWRDYSTIINAAAYTAVDMAETPEGRRTAWQVNALAVANLSMVAEDNGITLVHISSDYVFDGTEKIHSENETFAPLGVYAQTKAAGDTAVAYSHRHYIVRTSWVIGEGKNFVLTMKSLAEKGVKPSVVSDQIGRLTFTEDLAKGIKHLLDTHQPYGTYNLSNEGQPVSWADIAKEVYELSGKSRDDVTPVTTEEYYKGKEGIAPRPLQSTLNIDKIKSTGFTPREWKEALGEYLAKQ
jgi:dTDP-4-dehydrorhamnose 3,5-epimerase/reductase